MLKKFAIVACLLACVVSFLRYSSTVSAADPYTISTIEVPGSRLTAACGIDNLGRVVGYYTDGKGTHGFLFENGGVSSIDVPGAAWTAAFGINSAGQIVGGYG